MSSLSVVRAFVRLLVSRFSAHDALRNAAALTFTTLLSLVPLMTVILAVFSAFPIADKVSEAIQDFLFQNFVPTSGEVVRRYLQNFSDKASRLTGAGFALLIIVALLLMANIDRALNSIWEVRRQRSPLNQFVVYWAILSIGPLLIGVRVVATSYGVSLPVLSDAAASGVGRRLLGLTPLLASVLGFSLIYALVPNRRVSLRHAIYGGALAAGLFELAKWSFAWYLTSFPTYEAIYGALATIPIFLVWIYLSWLVVLFGAEFTHCLGIFRGGASGSAVRRLELVDAVRVLWLLGEAQERGRALSAAELVVVDPRWSEHHLEDLLNDLLELHCVHRTDGGGWALARGLGQIELNELARTPRFRVPVPDGPDWPQDPRLADVLQQADAASAARLRVSLAEIAKSQVE